MADLKDSTPSTQASGICSTLTFGEWVGTFEYVKPPVRGPVVVQQTGYDKTKMVAVEQDWVNQFLKESELKSNNLKLLTVQDIIDYCRNTRNYAVETKKNISKELECTTSLVREEKLKMDEAIRGMLWEQDQRDSAYTSFMSKLRNDIDAQQEILNNFNKLREEVNGYQLVIGNLTSRVQALEAEKKEAKDALGKADSRSEEDSKTIASLTALLAEEKKISAAREAKIGVTSPPSKISEEDGKKAIALSQNIIPTFPSRSYRPIFNGTCVAHSVSPGIPLVPPQSIKYDPALSISSKHESLPLPSPPIAPIQTNLLYNMTPRSEPLVRPILSGAMTTSSYGVSTPLGSESSVSTSSQSNPGELRPLKPDNLPDIERIIGMREIEKAFSYAMFGDNRKLVGNRWDTGIPASELRSKYASHDPLAVSFYNALYSTYVEDGSSEKNARRYVPWGALEIVDSKQISIGLWKFCARYKIKMRMEGTVAIFY